MAKGVRYKQLRMDWEKSGEIIYGLHVTASSQVIHQEDEMGAWLAKRLKDFDQPSGKVH